MKDFWLLKKHRHEIEYIDFSSNTFRQKIDAETSFKLSRSKSNLYNFSFDWFEINPSFGFFYDFENNESAIKKRLEQSKLIDSTYIYIETLSNIPIIKTKIEYFIRNWFDFVNANAGMGSFCITDDYKLLMEFTDDCKYFLFSNFPI